MNPAGRTRPWGRPEDREDSPPGWLRQPTYTAEQTGLLGRTDSGERR